MNSETHARFEARTKIIKALAHPTRLFVVDQLSHGDRCVCELAEMVGADVSTLSKHLTVLKNAGLVSDRKQGLSVHYTLRLPCVLNFFNCIESVLKANLKRQLHLVEKG